MSKEWKERISYVISEEGYYCGTFTNIPIVIQAKSLEGLKERSKGMFKIYIKDLQRTLDNDLFEYVEDEDILTVDFCYE